MSVSLADLFARADEAGLTRVERDAIARAFAGETAGEIAAVDGVTERAVRYRLQSAQRKLAALHYADTVQKEQR